MVSQWEYISIETNSTNAAGLAERMSVLGAQGWECVSVAAPDKTIGMNAIFAILKREIVPPPPPPPPLDPQLAEWYPDPCNRFDKRYWDGRLWTAHVAVAATKQTATDAPTMLPPP